MGAFHMITGQELMLKGSAGGAASTVEGSPGPRSN